MDIDKIKAAIKLDGSLVYPNPDGTIAIMPRDLNGLKSISLSKSEYRCYIEASLLTIDEKIERLKKLTVDKEINELKSSDRCPYVKCDFVKKCTSPCVWSQENIYKGFVIRESTGSQMFVGPTSEMYRVSLRSMASRFAKNEAIEYIKTGIFCRDGGPFIIESAV